jgi:hypothetical protein
MFHHKQRKFFTFSFFFISDVIHTDGGFFGIPWSIGHADFYPNGGVALQPVSF